MRNEDILRTMKNIDKTIPYENIREANKVYESVYSQMYDLGAITENVRLMSSGLSAMNAVSSQLYGVGGIAENVRLMSSGLSAMNAVSSQLYGVGGIAENVRLMSSGLGIMEQSYSAMMKNIEIYSNIANFVSNFNYNILTEEYEKRFLDYYSDDLDSYIRNNNWILPKFSTKDFITSLNDAMESNYDIDMIFVEFFKEDNFKILSKYYDSWAIDDVMSEGRMKIIYSTIRLIIDDNGEKYPDLIIPPLIAQIDNLISQILLKNGYYKNGSQFFKNVGKTDNPKGNHKTFIQDFAGTIIDDWDDNHVKFLLDSLFQPTQGKNVSVSDIMPFNRNNIMHGSEHDYGTFENVIRCFLIIDFLNDFLSDYKVSRLNVELKFYG